MRTDLKLNTICMILNLLSFKQLEMHRLRNKFKYKLCLMYLNPKSWVICQLNQDNKALRTQFYIKNKHLVLSCKVFMKKILKNIYLLIRKNY